MSGVEVCFVVIGLSKEEPIEALLFCYLFILKVILFLFFTVSSEEDLDSPLDATESKY